MKKTSIALVTSSLLVASSAFAQEPAPKAESGKEFGNPGVLNFGAATSLNFSYVSESPPQGASSSAIAFTLQPVIQYFVAEGFSVGGTALVGIAKRKDQDAITTFGIGPAVGYNAWLTPGFLSLWPQLGVLFQSTSFSTTTSVSTAGGTTSQTSSSSATKLTLDAWVPLLVHPVKHFHFGIGPYFDLDLTSRVSSNDVSADGNKNTIIGIKGEIAGWL